MDVNSVKRLVALDRLCKSAEAMHRRGVLTNDECRALLKSYWDEAAAIRSQGSLLPPEPAVSAVQAVPGGVRK